MMGIMRALTLCFALFAACGSVSTSYDFDPDAKFDQLKTYKWIPAPRSGAAESVDQSPLVLKRVRSAVDEQLAARGYKRVESGADFRIAARLSSRQRTRVTTTGSAYGYRRGAWGASDVDVYQYDEGSIILDIVDASGKNLMWRGVARSAVPADPTPEQITKIVNEAAQKLIANFPPKS